MSHYTMPRKYQLLYFLLIVLALLPIYHLIIIQCTFVNYVIFFHSSYSTPNIILTFFSLFSCSEVSFFSESLEKYSSEHEQAVSILEHRPIGMILVDCIKLKEVLIPSPLKCLEVDFISKYN